MAVSIVKVPQCAAGDMDFLAFSFNGQHSWDDFGIYRVIDGDRYNENLSPTLNDKTAEVPGGDGMYYFGTTHKQRDFNISFAFEHLTEDKLRKMKQWLNGKEMGDLWFSEAPYKVWTVKPAGNSAIKYIPFNDKDGQRVYKGEGNIQFTAYYPYAHTPDIVKNGDSEKDGKNLGSYSDFNNYEEWQIGVDMRSSGETTSLGENPGDIPAHFQIKIKNRPEGAFEETIRLLSDKNIISFCAEGYRDIIFDTKTGILKGIDATQKETILPYSGNGCVQLPVCSTGEFDEKGSTWSIDDIENWIYYQYKVKEEEGNTPKIYRIAKTVFKKDDGGSQWGIIDGFPTNRTLAYHYWYY